MNEPQPLGAKAANWAAAIFAVLVGKAILAQGVYANRGCFH